jgi:hypothetical protein
MAAGRPTTYTLELGERICELVATNTCGLDDLCDGYDFMPNESTVRLWRFKHPEFSTKYAQAKMLQAELLAEQIHKISNSPVMYHDSEGNERVDSGSVALARLRVDSIKWHASKLAPKIYGDRKQIEETNPAATLTKIRDLVADLNKTNVSDI